MKTIQTTTLLRSSRIGDNHQENILLQVRFNYTEFKFPNFQTKILSYSNDLIKHCLFGLLAVFQAADVK